MIGLFCRIIGLFCRIIGLSWTTSKALLRTWPTLYMIGLFWRTVGLFCRMIGFFWTTSKANHVFHTSRISHIQAKWKRKECALNRMRVYTTHITHAYTYISRITGKVEAQGVRLEPHACVHATSKQTAHRRHGARRNQQDPPGLVYRILGLFCRIVGLFCRILSLFCRILVLFCRVLGFCRIVGLFCRILGLEISKTLQVSFVEY